MHHNFNFKDVLAISSRPSWAIEDVLPPGAQLDFGRRFMPDILAQIGDLEAHEFGEPSRVLLHRRIGRPVEQDPELHVGIG